MDDYAMQEKISKDVVTETKHKLIRNLDEEIESKGVMARMPDYLAHDIQNRLATAKTYKDEAVRIDNNSGNIDANPKVAPLLQKYKDAIDRVHPIMDYLETLMASQIVDERA